MKCCWICVHFRTRLPPDNLPNCARFIASPLSEDTARLEDSLSLLKCHGARNMVDRFKRISLAHPGAPGDKIYCCCPGLLDLFRTNVVRADRLKATDPVVFKFSDIPINFCPVCGHKLELTSAVKDRMAHMRAGRKKPRKLRTKPSDPLDDEVRE